MTVPSHAPSQRVVIADDHPLFREALVGRVRRLLPAARVDEVADLPALQAALAQHTDIDLLLLDLNIPGAEGLSALVHALSLAPGTAVVVVSAMDDPGVMRRAMGLGAAGFLSKSAGLDEVADTLTRVLAGDIVPPHAVTGSAADVLPALNEAEANAARRIGQLSPQQYRIATMLAAGRLNKQIAWDLGITEATVKVHMSTILRKLGAQNRTQVALLMQLLNFDRALADAPAVDLRRT